MIRIITLVAELDDSATAWNNGRGVWTNDVVLKFGDAEVARWTVSGLHSDVHETEEEYAARFVAGKLAQLFTLIRDGEGDGQ